MPDPTKSRSTAVKMFRGVAEPLATSILSDRPYRIPRGFPRWEELAVAIALSLADGHSGDRATTLHAHRSGVWLAQNLPLYLVRTPLLRQFQDTDIPLDSGHSLLSGLEFPLAGAIFLFPDNALATPDGGCLDWVVVHLSDTARPELSTGQYRGLRFPLLKHEGNYRRNLHWSSVDTRTTVWFGGCSVDDRGNLITSDRRIGADEMGECDRHFTHQVRDICLQAFLAACFQPALVSAPTTTGTRRASGTRGNRKPAYWLPREIRIPDVPTTARRGNGGNGHASPHAHWRRGHWRNQPVGPGRRDRKLTWIRPSLVNAGGGGDG